MIEKIFEAMANVEQSAFVEAVMKVINDALSGEDLAKTAVSAAALVGSGMFARGVARAYHKYFSWSNSSFYWATRSAVAKGGVAGFFSLPVALIETVLVPVYAAIATFSPRSAEERQAMEQDVVTLQKAVERLRVAEDRLTRMVEGRKETQRKLESQDKTLAEVSKVVAQIDPVKFQKLLELEREVKGQKAAAAVVAPQAAKFTGVAVKAPAAPVGWMGKPTIEAVLRG